MAADSSLGKTVFPDHDDFARSIAVYSRDSRNASVSHSGVFHDLIDLSHAYQECTGVSSSDDTVNAMVLIQGSIREFVSGMLDMTEEEACHTASHLTSLITSSGMAIEDQFTCCNLLSDLIADSARTFQINTDFHEFTAEDKDIMSEKASAFQEQILDTIHLIFRNSDRKQRQYLISAKEYVEENYADCDLSLSSIADHLGISSSYLSRLFSNAYGLRFTQYLNDVRVRHAKVLLADENRLIKDVAADAGFSTVQNFMRVFKSKTGVSPSDYRAAISRSED